MNDPMEAPVEEQGPSEEELHQQRRDALDQLGGMLEQKKDTAVAHKSAIETRMLADEAQYWGRLYGGISKDDVAAGEELARNVTPVDNKTRAKTRIAAARIGDMLFPTNSPNWALRPTPEPEVSEEALRAEYDRQVSKIPPPAEGQPAPEAPPIDVEALSDKVAQRACRRMSKRIADALSQSDYNKIGRACINDACKLGTGIVKGPYVKQVTDRAYKPVQVDGTTVEVLETSRRTAPATARVSPWMFFPMPARSIKECEGTFELHLYNRTKLQQMVMTHGFDPEMTSQLLAMGPQRGTVEGILAQRAAITGDTSVGYDNDWAVWEYHGPINKDDMLALGLSVPEDDELTAFFGEVWFANGIVTRVSLSPLEADTALPYQVFNYEEDETSIFGFGIPFVMRDDQYVIDMMWDAMTHNAAVSAGPQIAITKGVVQPADGSFHVRGPKLWYITEEDVKISEAIQTMVIPSTIQQNMALYEQAKLNADENTNLPLLLGDTLGKQSGVPQSGVAMLINQQNIVQRQSAHGWDDNVTDPLITRHYDWFMQHDPDPSIKGDFETEVRGASYLLVKDTQAQHAQLLIQMAAQDPNLARMLHLNELYRVYLGFMDIPVEILLKSEEQIEREEAGAQPTEAEVLDMRRREAEIAKLEAETQAAILKAQPQPPPMPTPLSEKDIMLAELEYAKLGAAREAQDIQYEIEQIRRDTQLLRAAADEGLAYEKIRADMEKFHRKQTEDNVFRDRKQQSDEFFRGAEMRLSEYRDRMKAINLARGFDTFS